MLELYALAVGPLAWLAFGVFVIGSLARLFGMYSLAKKKDAPYLTYMSWKYSLRSIFRWLTPYATLGWRENPILTTITFIFHISLFLIPIFLMSHIVLWDAFWGIDYAALPDALADWLTVAVILACLFFAWRRLSLPEVKFVTSAHDWLVLALVFCTFATGFLAYHQIGDSLTVTTLHILCGEAMLVAIPFTRLSHMLFGFFSRAYTGSEFGGVRRAKDW
ncbi:MAG: TmcC family electron transfer complex membrane anchor subunit [Thermodesulfobacteriota bacterium]